MADSSRRRGVSKAEWLEAALEMLAERGIGGVTVEALARQLGIAKSGFYWHFRDRQELLEAVLDYWMHELTEVVSKNPEIIALPPIKRLERISEMIVDYDLAGYDLPVRQWALSDPLAARGVRRVNRLRLDFLRQTFAELGFEGDDLEMRTMLFVCYHSMEQWVFKGLSRKRRRALIQQRVALLTQPVPDMT